MIKRIDIPELESLNRALVDNGSRIEGTQDKLEDVLINLERNENDFKTGKIPKNAYSDIKRALENSRDELIGKLNGQVREGLSNISKTRELIKKNKL